MMYESTFLMNVFRGILVVLITFENIQKLNLKYVLTFDSSLLVYDKWRHVGIYAFTCLMIVFGGILVVLITFENH